MNLDPKILPGKRPLTCFDTKEAKLFIGKKCYICNNYDCFRDLELIQQTILKGVEDCEVPFHYNSDEQAEFCLPVEWVKPEESEKKYREYKDLDEFFDVTGLEIGDLIKLKFPGNNVAELLIVGGCDNGLFIGIHKYTFKQLFEMVEISISGEWQPFGIEEQV